MPRTKLGSPKTKGPPIDWPLAVILERKKNLHLEWSDIAERAGMSADTLRGLVSRKPTYEWPVYTLKMVCKAVGEDYRCYVAGSPEDKHRDV